MFRKHKQFRSTYQNQQQRRITYSNKKKKSTIFFQMVLRFAVNIKNINNFMFSDTMEKIVGHVVRPMRRTYDEDDLGQKIMTRNGHVFKRCDMQISYKPRNAKQQNQKLTIQASYFQRTRKAKNVKRAEKICVVALHGNIGNRLNAFSHIETIISEGLQFLCFDFVGCGNSDGQYITLGHEQKHQIHTVLDTIQRTYSTNKFILWGRSMGAVSATLYCSKYHCKNVIGMILDSPYCNVKEMIKDVAESKICFMPQFLFNAIIAEVDKKVLEKIGYSVMEIDVREGIKNIGIPVYMMHGVEDQVVSQAQVLKLFDSLTTNKKFEPIEGQDHNANRPLIEQEKALKWILNFSN